MLAKDIRLTRQAAAPRTSELDSRGGTHGRRQCPAKFNRHPSGMSTSCAPKIRAVTPAITASSGTPRPNRPRVTCRAAGREGVRSGLRGMLLPPMKALLQEGARKAAGLTAATPAGLHCTVEAIAAVQLLKQMKQDRERNVRCG